MRHICIYSTRRMRRSRKVIFRDLLCMASCPVLPPQTRDNADPFRGCILTDRNPFIGEAVVAPGMPLSTTTSSGGGE